MHCVEKLENAKKWKRTNCYNSTTDESLVLVGHSFFTTCILFVLCFCFTKMKSNWLYHFISLFLFNNLLWALFHTNKYISITPFQLKFKLKKKNPNLLFSESLGWKMWSVTYIVVTYFHGFMNDLLTCCFAT